VGAGGGQHGAAGGAAGCADHGAAGLPSVQANNWWGLAGPAGMASEQRAALSAVTREALGRNGLAHRLEYMGFVVVASTPDATTATVREDAARWSGVVR